MSYSMLSLHSIADVIENVGQKPCYCSYRTALNFNSYFDDNPFMSLMFFGGLF